MKKTIQTKRQAKAGNGFRKLHTRTTSRKRKLRAATAVADAHTDFESDVPNVGIGRALIVILIIHVVAIAVIYLHSVFIGNQPEEAVADKGQSSSTAAAVSPVAALVAPAAEPDHASGRYIVMTGDTYGRVAHSKNVDETSLRALNDSRPLRAGVVLDLPAELSSRPVAVHETPAQRITSAEVAAPAVAVAVPAVAVPVERVIPRAIVINEDPAASATLVQPVIATSLADSGKRYTVKSGDTVWRIASRYKVSRENLLKINGLTDPRKLYAGREIKIPTN